MCISFLVLICFFLITAGSNQQAANESNGKLTVTILGLFAMSSNNQRDDIAQGRAIEAATKLAIREVSSTPYMLQDVQLSLLTIDTECDSARAVWSITNYIFNYSKPVIILGPPCTASANLLVSITDRHTNILSASYETTSIELLNYPSCYQFNPVYIDLYNGLHKLLVHFNWQRVCLINEKEPHYVLAVEKLYEYIEVLKRINNGLSDFNITETIFDLDSIFGYCRIFVVLSTPSYFRRILCDAIKANIFDEFYYDDFYQWIFLGSVTSDIIKSNDTTCSEKDLKNFIQSTIVIDFNTSNEYLTDFGMKLGNEINNISRYDIEISARAYDAIWTFALGMNNSRSYNLLQYFNDTLKQSINSLNFQGVSNGINFNSLRHHILSDIVISQWQEDDIVPIALIKADGETDWMYYANNTFTWPNGMPPVDNIQYFKETLPGEVSVSLLGISIIGCIAVFVIFCINVYFRGTDVIKGSNVHINNIILIGLCIGFLSIFFITLIASDYSEEDASEYNSIFCNVSCWLINLSFTIAFGSMVIRTWRIYIVFRNPWTKTRMLKNPLLLLLIFLIIGFEVVILIVLVAVAPLSVVYTPAVYTEVIGCTSSDNLTVLLVLIGVLMTYKLLLIIFGGFFAYKIRKVQIKTINDSRCIGLAIYSVLVVIVPGLFITFILFVSNTIWAYFFLNVTILLYCLVIFCTIFLPKIYLLFEKRKSFKYKLLLAENNVRASRHSVTIQQMLPKHITKKSSVKDSKAMADLQKKFWATHRPSENNLLAHRIEVKNPSRLTEMDTIDE
jgi:gamma-aminobutyric acid type B receptor